MFVCIVSTSTRLRPYGNHTVDARFCERSSDHSPPDRQIGPGDHDDFSHTAIMARLQQASSGRAPEES